MYFSKVDEQCEIETITLGNISDKDVLSENLKENCITDNISSMDVTKYDDFLIERRRLMAKFIEKYNRSL